MVCLVSCKSVVTLLVQGWKDISSFGLNAPPFFGLLVNVKIYNFLKINFMCICSNDHVFASFCSPGKRIPRLVDIRKLDSVVPKNIKRMLGTLFHWCNMFYNFAANFFFQLHSTGVFLFVYLFQCSYTRNFAMQNASSNVLCLPSYRYLLTIITPCFIVLFLFDKISRCFRWL